MVQHPSVTTGKTIALTRWTFVSKVMSMLSRFAITFLPKSKHLIISWVQLSFSVILEPKKRKSVTASTFPPSFCHEVMGQYAMILVFWTLSFKSVFSFSSFNFSKRLFAFLVPLCFLPLGWYHLHIWDFWYFSWLSWFSPVLHPAQHFTCCTLHRS